MNTQRALFEAIVATSGLAATIGPGTVQRALGSVGVLFPDRARPEDYRRALPQLRARMAIYLPPSELDQRLTQIEALLTSPKS
jgi:hypothetical protein